MRSNIRIIGLSLLLTVSGILQTQQNNVKILHIPPQFRQHKKVVIKKFALLKYIKKVNGKRHIKKNLLRIIAYGETGIYSHPYQVRQGGFRFYGWNYPKYPPKKGYTTASGKYQITKVTWLFIKKHINLPNFSPKNQDKAAWWYAKYEYNKETHRNLVEDMKSNNTNIQHKILSVLSKVWISLKKRHSLDPRCFLKT